MGNYQFGVQKPPQPGTILKIKDNKFTHDNEMPTDLLKRGEQVKVIKTSNMYQSRNTCPPITVSTVQFRDGSIDAYLTTNLGS